MAETPAAPTEAGTGKSMRARAARRAKRILWRVLALVAVLAIAGPVLWLSFVLNYSYSKGDRAGQLQKLSQRGWVCKTWEGELLMSTLPGAVPEKFEFSVRDEAVVQALQQQLGRPVALRYEQHKGVPSCFGETEYFVTGVRRMEP